METAAEEYAEDTRGRKDHYERTFATNERLLHRKTPIGEAQPLTQLEQQLA